MKNQSTKQKLVNLVSALENKDAIEYFYTLISLKLYGTSACPDSCFEEVCKMHDDYEERKKQEEPKVIKNSGINKDIADCITDIIQDVAKIGNENNIDALNNIKIFIANIRNELE